MIRQRVNPVVLAMCPQWGKDTPPLGIAYLKAFLESQGRTVFAFDFNIEVYNRLEPQFQKYWQGKYVDLWTAEFVEMIAGPLNREMDWVVECIMEKDPGVVGFSVIQTNLYFTFEIAKRLKLRNPRLVIIMGGPGVYWTEPTHKVPMGLLGVDGLPAFPMDVVDIFVHGEGEETLESCLKKLERGEDLREINSISTRVNGHYSATGPHRPNRDPDVFPWPVFDWVHFEKYREDVEDIPNPRIVPILLSRGCTNSCKFCNDFIMQGKHRYRSPESVFREMRQRVLGEDLRHIYFLDLLVNGNLQQLGELSEKLARSRLARTHNLMWYGQALARGDMDQKYMCLLKEGGCHSLSYGVESLSDKVLLAMRKNITVRDIESVLKSSKRAGIEVSINLIAGHPGEGEAEFQETLDNLRRFAKYIKSIAALGKLSMNYGTPHFAESMRTGNFNGDPEWHRRWVLKEYPDNTYEVRHNRYQRLQSTAEELGLVTLFPKHYEVALTEVIEELDPSHESYSPPR